MDIRLCENNDDIKKIDNDEPWKRYANADHVDLGTKDILWAAMHEIGHALGLEHSRKPKSIMMPIYQSSMDSNGKYVNPKLILSDIENIQDIYGIRDLKNLI